MLQIAGASDKIQMVTSAAGDVDCVIDFAKWDLTTGAPPVSSVDYQATTVTTAATTDVLAAAGANVDFTAGIATKNFSLDGCATSLGTFSTGVVHGDGRQASHWKDNLGLGIMDPTAGTGELLTVTALDLTAFDAIGWTPAPEIGRAHV